MLNVGSTEYYKTLDRNNMQNIHYTKTFLKRFNNSFQKVFFTLICKYYKDLFKTSLMVFSNNNYK